MQYPVSIGRSWLRRLLILLLLLASVAAMADTVAWFRLERLLDTRVTRFTAGAARTGWSVQARRGERGGWPFAATLRITGLRLAADRGTWPGRLEWSGDRVELSLSPLHPGVLHVALPGTQSLQLGDLSLRGWGSGLGLDSDGGGRITITADALHLARAGAGPDDVLQCAAVRAELHWRPYRQGGTDLALTLHEIAMPLLGAGEGRVAERARLVAVLDGPLSALLGSALPGTTPPGTAPRGGALPPGAEQVASPPAPGGPSPATATRGDARAAGLSALLSRWGRNGGAIRLVEASLDWPDAGLFLSGRVTPDRDGLFDGDLVLDLSHPQRPLSVLRRAGAIGAGQETAMLAVIGLVGAGQADQPAGDRIRLPLSLRRGVLRLGDIPLVALPAP